MSDVVFQSTVPYDPQRIHGAAVYCSDGRFGEHCDDFLHNGLGLPRYDRVAIPGGPGSLVSHPDARLDSEGLADELKFLVRAHKLDRIVLISHFQCAFYLDRLGIAPDQLEAMQVADLAEATKYLHSLTGVSRIESFFARPVLDTVQFERVIFP